MAVFSVTAASDVLCRNGRPSVNGAAMAGAVAPAGATTLDIIYKVHGGRGVGGRVGVWIGTGASATNLTTTAAWVKVGDCNLDGSTIVGTGQVKRILLSDALVTALIAEAATFFKIRLEPRDGTEYQWKFSMTFTEE